MVKRSITVESIYGIGRFDGSPEEKESELYLKWENLLKKCNRVFGDVKLAEYKGYETYRLFVANYDCKKFEYPFLITSGPYSGHICPMYVNFYNYLTNPYKYCILKEGTHQYRIRSPFPNGDNKTVVSTVNMAVKVVKSKMKKTIESMYYEDIIDNKILSWWNDKWVKGDWAKLMKINEKSIEAHSEPDKKVQKIERTRTARKLAITEIIDVDREHQRVRAKFDNGSIHKVSYTANTLITPVTSSITGEKIEPNTEFYFLDIRKSGFGKYYLEKDFVDNFGKDTKPAEGVDMSEHVHTGVDPSPELKDEVNLKVVLWDTLSLWKKAQMVLFGFKPEWMVVKDKKSLIDMFTVKNKNE